MADDVQDIAIYTGSEWTSLSELAAGVVDAKLPIESVDGTVKLDGASSVFTVSTGGTERAKVDESGRFLVGNNAGDNANFNNHFRTYGDQQFVIESDTGQPQLKLKADDFWYYLTLNPTDDKLRLVSYNGKTNASNNVFTASPDGSLGFTNGIQTPSVRGLADNDASVTLGQQATLKTGGGSEYVPTDSASIATKKIVDDKIWVGTTAQYLAIPPRDILPTTLYCLTD